MSEQVGAPEGLSAVLETAYRRAGGLPMLSRTPEGRAAIIKIAVNEANAARATPPGYVLVPVEITLAMQHAYFEVIDANMRRVETDPRFGRFASQQQAYRAMIASRPKGDNE